MNRRGQHPRHSAAGRSPPACDRIAAWRAGRIPYYWLRDDERRDPAVRAYLEAENAYKERHLAPGRCATRCTREIVARLQAGRCQRSLLQGRVLVLLALRGRQGAPDLRAPHSPRSRHPRRSSSTATSARPRAARRGTSTTRSARLKSRRTRRWLAFCEDFVGRRQYELRFKNLARRRSSSDAITNVESDVAWANDNATLLYVEKDPETLLGIYVKKHALGADPALDALVFTQIDTSFYTGVAKSKSERYIFISMESTVSSEWRYADADDPALEFKVFLPHERDHEYQIEHLGRPFHHPHQLACEQFPPHARRSARRPTGRAGKSWSRTAMTLSSRISMCSSASSRWRPPEAVCRRSASSRWGSSAMRRAHHSSLSRATSPPTPWPSSINPRLDTDVLRYSYSSLTTPTSIYDYDVRTGKRQLLKRDPVLGPFDPANYQTEFLLVPARDGKRCRCPWCTGAASRATAPHRFCSTAMAPTASPWILISQRRA